MKTIELSLESYMYTLSLVLSGFNWEYRGRILDSRSALNFIKHQLVPNVLQRYLGCAHTYLSCIMGCVGNLQTVLGFTQPALAL